MPRTLLMVIILLFSPTVFAFNKYEVLLYTYHNKPPFVVNESLSQGLYYDLAVLLTDQSDTYNFKAVYIPRKRLDYLLDKNEIVNGIVVGVSPVWFKDKQELKYLWLPTFYRDRDEFVSLKSSKFEYQDRESLNNKIVAGVAGYYYHGINESVKKGLTNRIDTIGEIQVLSLLEKGRANMGIVSRSVFNYLARYSELPEIYHFSAKPHDAFDRRMFTTKDNQQLFEHMKPLLQKVINSPEWQQILDNYQ